MITISKFSLTSLARSAAMAALLASTAAPALAGSKTIAVGQQPPAAADLKTTMDGAKSTPVPCNGVARCNSIIAYCAEKGGTWTEQAHNTQGQPTKGRCDVQ
jgi:hypothetical protein